MQDAGQALGLIEKHRGRLVEAKQAQRKSYRLLRELGNRHGAANVAANLTMTLVWGAYEEASGRFQQAATVLTEYGKNTRMMPLMFQAFALCRFGRPGQAAGVLAEALRESIVLHVFFVVVNALPAAAQLAATAGDAERTLVLCALAGRYPYVANSRWIADIVGGDVDEWAASLTPDAATAARARGRALDLWKTAAELMVAFGGESVLR